MRDALLDFESWHCVDVNFRGTLFVLPCVLQWGACVNEKVGLLEDLGIQREVLLL